MGGSGREFRECVNSVCVCCVVLTVICIVFDPLDLGHIGALVAAALIFLFVLWWCPN